MSSNNSKQSLENEGRSVSFLEFSEDRRSPLRKYQDIIVGNHRLSNLVAHELLTFFLTNMPALPGLFLRQKLYKILFKSFGRNSTIGTGVALKQPGKISIGSNCAIDDLVHLSIRGDDSCQITLADKIFIGRATEIKLRHGEIAIGESSSIGSSCRIATNQGTIHIGEHVFIAAYCYIGGGNHITERTDIPITQQGFESKGGVIIGDDVWIGANCVIADGVTIGKGSIIGACSFVNKDIPEYSIAFGSPATVKKARK
jgi:acetyltransferase-like isoleucine patch superfamily enzyme